MTEITGMEGDNIQMHDLFVYEQQGVDDKGNATGRFVATGIRPRCAGTASRPAASRSPATCSSAA